MNHTARKWALSLLAGACLFCMSAGTSQAGIIPWMYDLVFDPNYRGAPYAVGYGYRAPGWGRRPDSTST